MKNSQCINLFDRQFVANTIRNSCRCPHCHNEYSYCYDMPDKYAKDDVIKSNRPILLPCGHNMCENCVYTNRQNLMCKVCLKPVELPVKKLRHRTSFNVRDHFDLNFFLLGELNHLRYYRKDSSSNSTLLATTQNSINSINKSILASSSWAPSSIKCTECEFEPSFGQCRQCKVYYCKQCYDSIHKNSKVLKKHNIQRFDNKNKQMDSVLRPHFCKRHKRVCDRFCPKCNYVCCSDCARNDHHTHGYQTLLELNKRNVDGVICTLENVKIIRDNIKKALKVSPNPHSK